MSKNLLVMLFCLILLLGVSLIFLRGGPILNCNFKDSPKSEIHLKAVVEDLDRILEKIPLAKDELEDLLKVEFRLKNSPSNPYYLIYLANSSLYDSIEFRIHKSEKQKGILILKLLRPIPFNDLLLRYGKEYSLEVASPQDPVMVTCLYQMKKCRLSFAIKDKAIKLVDRIVIDWINY